MIPKISNVSFKAAFLSKDEDTQRIVKKQEAKYTFNGQLKPFPQDDLMKHAKTLGKFSDQYECDCVFSVKDKDKDTFVLTADIYDQNTAKKLDTLTEDSERYKNEDKLPFVIFFSDIKETILRKRFIIP